MPTAETEINYDLKEVILPSEDWSASHALSVVTSDFSAMENYRTQNHDWRWERADRRYFGVVPAKVWEGTNIARANISVMTAYDQVEALIPVVMQAIFGDEPWFEATALGTTTPEAARKSREVIAAQLYQSRVRSVLEEALRSAFIYGNGLMESSWYYCVRKKKKFRVQFDPVSQMITDPVTLLSWPAPTGRYQRRIVESIVEEVENRPILKAIPITQFYIDANCPNTDPENAQATVTRTLEPISTLIDWRDEDGYDIPDDGELLEWTKQKTSAQGDLTQQNREAARDANWQPSVDQSSDPAARRVEVLRYKTNHRIVMVVNRKHVIYNRTNEYGRKMQYSPFYTKLIDRFYGMSVCDVVDGEQLLQEGLINSNLDEISLGLHPHTKAKSHRQLSAYQLRVRPGGVSYHEDPKNDMIREYPSGITADAMSSVAMSDMRVQKKTGLTDVALLGLSSGPNPGARSATGAGIQGRATQTRIQSIVESVADATLDRFLADFHMLNDFHLDPDQRIQAVSGESLDPLQLFGAEVRYSSRAASRMQSRIGLMQFIPYIVQYLMNPALIQELSAQGKTVDYEEIFQMLIEATGYRRKATWIRPMTPQEQQALQQSKPSPDMIKWMMQKERLQTLGDQQQDKSEMAIAQTIVKNKGDVNKLVVEHALTNHEAENRGNSG